MLAGWLVLVPGREMFIDVLGCFINLHSTYTVWCMNRLSKTKSNALQVRLPFCNLQMAACLQVLSGPKVIQ